MTRHARLGWVALLLLAAVPLSGCRIVWVSGVTSTLDAPPGVTAVEIPAEFHDGWIIVEATVNGRGPFPFILDTGAGFAAVSERFLKEVGIEPTETLTVTDGAGVRADYPAAVGVEIQVGPLRLRDVKVAVPEAEFGSAFKPQVVGIIGYAGLGRFVLDLDYPNETVRLHTTPLRRSDPGVVPLRRYRAGTPDVLLAHTSAAGVRDTRWLTVDSGGAFTLNLNPAASMAWTRRDEGRVLTVGMTFSGTYSHNVTAPLRGDLSLGDTRVRRAEADVDEPMSLIGHGLLRHFRVRLDGRSGLAAFTPADPTVTVMTAPRHAGVGVTESANFGEFVLVVSLDPHSPAATAGLRPGDRILAIDGTPTAQPGPHHRMWRLDPPPEITLTVLRDADPFDLSVPTEPAFPDDPSRRPRQTPDLTLPGVNLGYGPDYGTIFVDRARFNPPWMPREASQDADE